MFVHRFVNLVVDLDSIAFCFVQVCCLRSVCRSHFVFGVVGVVVVVVVPWLLSLSVVHLYLLVTGTFFFPSKFKLATSDENLCTCGGIVFCVGNVICWIRLFQFGCSFFPRR